MGSSKMRALAFTLTIFACLAGTNFARNWSFDQFKSKYGQTFLNHCKQGYIVPKRWKLQHILDPETCDVLSCAVTQYELSDIIQTRHHGGWCTEKNKDFYVMHDQYMPRV